MNCKIRWKHLYSVGQLFQIDFFLSGKPLTGLATLTNNLDDLKDDLEAILKVLRSAIINHF